MPGLAAHIVRQGLLLFLEFFNVNILEPKRVAVVLQFNLARRIDGFRTVPIIFEHDIVHNELVV